jgi:hypothetical protein
MSAEQQELLHKTRRYLAAVEEAMRNCDDAGHLGYLETFASEARGRIYTLEATVNADTNRAWEAIGHVVGSS